MFFSCSLEYQELKEQKQIKKEKIKQEKRKERQKKIRERNSDSQFLAYYNSYYLAKIKFKDALALLDKESSSTPSNNAITLLDDAIKYSDIVIANFYNTDFIYDASYIKARSSYLKNIISPASYYFNEIIKNTESPFYYNTLVQLGFISIKLGDDERLSQILEQLDNNVDNFYNNIKSLNHKIPYQFLEDELSNIHSSYYILKAEASIYWDEPVSVIEGNYLLALKNTNSQSKLIGIYNSLISIFKDENNEEKILEYTNMLKDNMDVDLLSDDFIDSWFEHNRKPCCYQKIHEHIDKALQSDILIKDKIYFLLEKGKTYVSENKIEEAKQLFEDLILDYEDVMNNYKNYFSEIYYELANIYLRYDIDYEQALNYFDLSVEKQSTNSKASLKSKALNDFMDLDNQYSMVDNQFEESDTTITQIDDSLLVSPESDNPFFILAPADIQYQFDSNFDTLLFDMGSILFFDLELEDMAYQKFKSIFDNYSESQLMSQTILMLNEIRPNEDWNHNQIDSFIKYSLNDTLNNEHLVKHRRNLAFEQMNHSLDSTIIIFENNYKDHDDLFSLYMVGFIYDIYINDIYKAVEFYKQYAEYEGAEESIKVKNRLNELESNLDLETNTLELKIAYFQALEFIEDIRNFSSPEKDTLILRLDELSNNTIGLNQYKIKTDKILSIFKFPKPSELIDSLTVGSSIDFTDDVGRKKPISDVDIYKIAGFLQYEIGILSIAGEYYKLLIDYYPDSPFIFDAYVALHQIDSQNNWNSSLLENVSESFAKIEKFTPRTGADVIEATKKRLMPIDLQSTNNLYTIPLDTNNTEINISTLEPRNIYKLQYKENYWQDGEDNIRIHDDPDRFAIISAFDNSGDVSNYFMIDEKALILNDSKVFKLYPNKLNNNKEAVEIESYFFNTDLQLIAYDLFNTENNFRYNINNTKSDCIYKKEPLFCYEIEMIPNEDNFYRTAWFLEIEENTFLKIKEDVFDNNGDLLTQREFEYSKIELYYILENVKEKNLQKQIVNIMHVDNIKLNNGVFSTTDIAFNQFKAGYNNFLVREYNPLADINFINLDADLNRLLNMKTVLFPLPVIEDSIIINEDSNMTFDYVQSINQYFYFVEDASIDGIELIDSDWLVAYNDDIVVGARQYILGGNIDIPIMGYDNSSENTKIATERYCENGDIPTIYVHRVNGDIIEMEVILVEGDLEFKGLGHAIVILKKD